MDITAFLPLIATWLAKQFPSLSEYVEYVGPVVVGLLTAIGIFTNLLPEPNTKYPVPDVTALETQLQGSGGFILKIAKWTRSLVIGINWFIATAVYAWFYNFLGLISRFVPKFKKKTTK